jgi:uncharacterized membrane protein YkvA (DUF1232 family)
MHPLTTLLCVLYVIWPIYFISDFFPILGWIDDLGVLVYMGSQLLSSKNA